MSRTCTVFRKGRKKRQGRRINGSINGKPAGFRLAKSLPKHCSRPRQICIRCLIVVIHKNDKNYGSKICKHCTALNLPGVAPE